MTKNKYDLLVTTSRNTGKIVSTCYKKENEEYYCGIRNKKQVDAFKEKKCNIEEIKEFIKDNQGSYFHLIYKYSYPIFEELQNKFTDTKANIHIVRFIQLASFVTFGGKLFDDNGNEIKKSSLSKIWDVKNNRKSINDTYKILTECGYIHETKEGYIMINEELVIKGIIKDLEGLKQYQDNITYTRVFANNIQALYKGTEPKSRKKLANLFKILPFINFKYNVFCSNPTEVDESKLQLYTWNDLARLCGVDDKHASRFKKDLFSLKVYGNCVLGQFLTDNGYAICVNPKIYYAGSNTDDIKHLYSMFKMTSK